VVAQGLAARWRGAAQRRIGPTEQSLIAAWRGIGTTFGITRVARAVFATRPSAVGHVAPG
jgi:hypothetical protein